MIRVGMRIVAGVLACAYFVLLATGLMPPPPWRELLPQCALMALFLVYAIFGLKAADTLLGLIVPQPSQKPATTNRTDDQGESNPGRS